MGRSPSLSQKHVSRASASSFARTPRSPASQEPFSQAAGDAHDSLGDLPKRRPRVHSKTASYELSDATRSGAANTSPDLNSSQDFRHRRSTSLGFSLQNQQLYQQHQQHQQHQQQQEQQIQQQYIQQPQFSFPADPASPRESDQSLAASPMVEISLEKPPAQGMGAFYERNKGLAYVLLAQVFGVLMNVTTRLLEVQGNRGDGMHPFQILFVRMAITTTLSTGYMYYTSTPHFPFGLPEVRWLLMLRGIGGFFGVFGMYYSLMYLPLADATVVTFISPILSCWACSMLLKEPFTRMEQVGAFVSFMGVTMIAQPSTFFHHGASTPPTDVAPDGQPPALQPRGAQEYNSVTGAQRMGAVCVALVGVVGQAGAFTAMRWIGKRAHPLLSVTYFCAWCTVVSAVAMIILPNVRFLLPQGLKEWTYLIFLGVCGFAMQFLLSAGLQREKSSRATNMVYTQMLFALILDKLVFGTNPTLLSLLGSSLILGSAIYIAVQKENMKAKQEEVKARQAAAGGASADIEMQQRTRARSIREEEQGLVAGMDDNGDEEGMKRVG